MTLDLAIFDNYENPPKKGDHIFVFSELSRLRSFLYRACGRLTDLGIKYEVYGLACIDTLDGNRMIFVVRHSPEWRKYVAGYIIVKWMSDVELPENEVEFLNTMMH